MANVVAQRAALRDHARSSIPGLNWYERGQDLARIPAGIVDRVEGPELLGLSAVYRTLYQVIIVPGRVAQRRRAGAHLDTYLATEGAASFQAAIDADRTLDGTVDAALVGTPIGDEPYQVNGAEYVCTRIPVEVISP